MSWFNIKHSCSHERTYYLTGTTESQKYHAMLYESVKCPNCQHKSLIEPRRVSTLDFENYLDANSFVGFLKNRGYETVAVREWSYKSGKIYQVVFYE